MYDLEYAQAEGFNKHEHYAYLRHCEEETLLIAINFDDKHAEMQIRIPAEAFAYLHIQPCTEVQFTDLLSGQTFTRPFLPNTSITLSLEAWKGMILKID